MARRPRIETSEDGSAILRIRFQPSTWALICRYAEKLGLHEEDAARIFLQQIDALIATHSLTWLSADWRAIAREGREPAAPVVAQIDATKLHRSEKLKSGFYGVYASGQGFRAMGPRGTYLVTCQTALEAAWRRYQHYMEHGLAYGELEVEVERLRREGEQGTDQTLRRIVLETAKLTGTLHIYAEYMTPEEVERYGTGGDAGGPRMLGFEIGTPDQVVAELAAHEGDEDPITGRDGASAATNPGAPPLGWGALKAQ